MTQKSSSKPQPLITQAIAENGDFWSNVVRRELPPIALLGAAALMLRNVSLPALVDAIAPALVEMVELADEETQLELEEFAEEGRPYTFELWLTSFEFEPFHETQPEFWRPFRDALEELPGEGDIATFREDIVEDGRTVGMLLWLVLHMVFDAVREERLAIDDPKPENRWLAALLPSDWVVAPLLARDYHRDAVGLVLAHLYNEARKDWEWPSELAPERRDLTERFLMPPLPKPYIVDDID
ncbi:hypothetical protein PK98_15690 [Croceibacterium mercuriale]|uniref:Uncharacterized protein n=1 Tax=Croceibacterium mercuriale TaxID=1572751 RepID=A0A0B2BVX5_9SPHN|nr:hypothetical protein [Croceibacterium mercuriale]KHL24124.1 hypothetical protein PK98_15690 [Croceibacterium mercuriale]